MSRAMRAEVLWAIRDCRTLNAREKSLLYAVETRGVHFGTWETVAADAGLGRDGFYSCRRRLEARGALMVTERPGRTTLHEVNADWISNETLAETRNDPYGNASHGATESRNDP